MTEPTPAKASAPTRDPALEHQLLTGRGILTPARRDFQAHCLARLQIGARDYGDTWATRPTIDLLREQLEEAADLAAWGVLAYQTTNDSPTRAVIRHVIHLVAVAHANLAAAIHHLNIHHLNEETNGA